MRSTSPSQGRCSLHFPPFPRTLPVPSFRLASSIFRSLTCITRSHPALFISSIVSNDFRWIWRDAPPASAFSALGFRASAQIRHRMATVPVTVRQRWTSNAVQITFDEPCEAVAQGQIAALYDGDHCLGCGTIDETTSMASFGEDQWNNRIGDQE
jgi:tRNA U34 2-thiouridine synthase MnmA/TrmU